MNRIYQTSSLISSVVELNYAALTKPQPHHLVALLNFFLYSKFLSLSLSHTLTHTQTQAALLTKYLWIGKHCYESRNFATAMQVLCGLENVIVRQLPVRLLLKKPSYCK